jgi:coniferyl-aldehyde dehydrogenase
MEAEMNAHVMTGEVKLTSEVNLTSLLERQRAAFLREGPPTFVRRIADLAKLKEAVLARRKDFEATIDADFGHRPAQETAILELVPTIQGIDYLRTHLRRWMLPRRRHVAIHLLPGSAKLLYQPLGVVGIVSPWNYPVGLCLMPLATAIAAGDRVMLKPSEFTPRTTELMATMLGEIFPADQIAVVSGGAEVGAAFSALAFDHIVFTGSTNVGRAVMHATADNLVPVTLELGGKSPAIVDREFPLSRVAPSIAFGKLMNAGQTCIAPDYALLHESEVDAFVAAYDSAVRASYPRGAADSAYASIINEQHYKRLAGLIEDARAKGARILDIGVPAASPMRAHTLPPTVILDTTPDMKIMNEEIFGPILPIVGYREINDAIAYVNARPRPLALYIFSDRPDRVAQVLARTTSGNVTVNDTLLHYVVDDLPFGGVGASGIGAYHGEEGFKSLSHAKGVFKQARWNFASLVRAPFGRMTDMLLKYMLR